MLEKLDRFSEALQKRNPDDNLVDFFNDMYEKLFLFRFERFDQVLGKDYRVVFPEHYLKAVKQNLHNRVNQ